MADGLLRQVGAGLEERRLPVERRSRMSAASSGIHHIVWIMDGTTDPSAFFADNTFRWGGAVVD